MARSASVAASDAGEREPVLGQERRFRRDDARVARLVQRQAAGFVAGTQPEARDRARARSRRAGRLSSSRPAGVFGLNISGATDSAISTKPPVPEFLASEAPAGSFRNAPTETITKQAKAMSAADSTLRVGRQRA